MAVAADLEGTLTAGETWRGVGAHVAANVGAWHYRWFLTRRVPAVLAVRAGRLDRREFQRRWMRDLLTFYRGYDTDAFGRMAEWVVEHELWPKRRHDVIAALRVHLVAGDRLLLASGTYQRVLEAFASRLAAATGRPVEAIGTLVEVDGGRLTGRIASPVNVGEEKARRVHDALGSERLAAAYGDSAADVPLLLLSDHAVAVYPDDGLRRTARDLGWSVLDG